LLSRVHIEYELLSERAAALQALGSYVATLISANRPSLVPAGADSELRQLAG